MKTNTPVLLCCFAAAASAVFGQGAVSTAAADRIEVSITRTVNLKVEEAAFNVAISAPSSSTLAALVKAVEPTGITETDLLNITPFFGPPSPVPSQVPRVIYNFQLRASSSQLSETLQKLEQLRRSLLAGDGGFELVAQNLIGFGASDKAREAARGQLTSDALADARSRAEALAKAAGVVLGPIVGLSEFPSGYVGPTPGIPPSTLLGITVTVRFSTNR